MSEELDIVLWYRKLLQNPPIFDGIYNKEKSWTIEDWCRFFKIKNPKDIKLRSFVKTLIKEGILVSNGNLNIMGQSCESYVLIDNKLKIVNALERTEN